MSIISAIKFAMAYYSHKDIVWIPISLEELLRVSGNAGSKKEGLLSAKNLHFEHGATCDDLLLIGIEKTPEKIFIHLHPVEVKIGQNAAGVGNAVGQHGTVLLDHGGSGIGRHECLTYPAHDHGNRIVAQCQQRVADQNRNADPEILTHQFLTAHEQIPDPVTDPLVTE